MKNDIQIQKDILAQLEWEPSLESASIGVSVKNGVVTLSGIVQNYSQKVMAENAASKIVGVKAVAEDIQVGPTFFRTDTEIAEAVVDALKWHAFVKEDQLRIKVENGFVTLEGEVEWAYQRKAAQKAIENLEGVRGINNQIAILPKDIKVLDIKEKIGAAFLRSASIDASKVHVEIVDRKVILKGIVSSLVEKEEAENATWFAPGVSAVENRLEVEDNIGINKDGLFI